MCGIIGYIGNKNARTILLGGLKRLEYRGYDSAGIALITENRLKVFKKAGKISNLESIVPQELSSSVGIGHTRWATHGKPDDVNAHPHTDCSGKLAVVHNGIIENYQELKKELEKKGHRFSSSTDTEVIAHLLEEEAKNKGFVKGFFSAVSKLKGSFAIVAISLENPDRLLCARKDSPLVIGIGEGESFVASDVPAFLQFTRKVVFLEDFQIAIVKKDSVEIYDFSGKRVSFSPVIVQWNLAQAEKAGFKHFMLKEIYEQPRAVADTISANKELFLKNDVFDKNFNKIQIVACGTSYYAGLIGKFYFETFARIPTEVDYASEYRYRNPVVDKNTLVISITQSGETADTLSAMRLAKERGAKLLTICNVIGSTATREADTTIYTYAGPEISVASTKAFTTQLTVLYLLSNYFGKKNMNSVIESLAEVPSLLEEFLRRQKESGEVEELAEKFYKTKNALYLGRHINYPIALEGALKLKEISYIHAEGYPAGEMKHGPIALIDEDMLVVFVCGKGETYKKILSNMEEVKARHGKIIAVATKNMKETKELADYTITVPETELMLSPIVNVVPLQLFAYHIASFLGYDVDQPRNLAKSVTVE